MRIYWPLPIIGAGLIMPDRGRQDWWFDREALDYALTVIEGSGFKITACMIEMSAIAGPPEVHITMRQINAPAPKTTTAASIEADPIDKPSKMTTLDS